MTTMAMESTAVTLTMSADEARALLEELREALDPHPGPLVFALRRELERVLDGEAD